MLMEMEVTVPETVGPGIACAGSLMTVTGVQGLLSRPVIGPDPACQGLVSTPTQGESFSLTRSPLRLVRPRCGRIFSLVLPSKTDIQLLVDSLHVHRREIRKIHARDEECQCRRPAVVSAVGPVHGSNSIGPCLAAPFSRDASWLRLAR